MLARASLPQGLPEGLNKQKLKEVAVCVDWIFLKPRVVGKELCKGLRPSVLGSDLTSLLCDTPVPPPQQITVNCHFSTWTQQLLLKAARVG